MTMYSPNINKLFYGDNLEVLREHIADESVDLVYLDPPTKGMLSEAASAGRFQLPGLTKTYPIVGEGLCALPPREDGTADYSSNGSTRRCSPTGKRPDLPDVSDTLKKAKRITKPQTKTELGI